MVQCSQKGSSLKCTACNRKGHIAKACYMDMLKKSGTVKINMVSGLLALQPKPMSPPHSRQYEWLYLTI